MTTRRLSVVAGCLVLAMAVVACGKKGDPLPPLRPVPARVDDLRAVRTAGQVELRFTVPATNVDGTTPVAIDRIDVYAYRAAPDADPLPAGTIADDEDNFLASLPVRPPADPAADEEDATVSTLVPRPGELGSYVDVRAALAEEVVVTYVLVPVVGSGRGRPGPPSDLASVPLGSLPAAPAAPDVGHTESELVLTWAPAGAETAYRVLQQGDDGQWVSLTTNAVSESTFSTPVEFGVERCVAVQALRVRDNVTVEGAVSSPTCLTAVDTYPPAPPASLVLVQEGPSVTLMWGAVEAPDLAGYVVLRSDGAEGPLVPLFEAPITARTYRDTTVTAGTTYSYAVRAVDTAPAANTSNLSPREAIAVR